MPKYIEREALLKTLKHRVKGQEHHISNGVNMALSLIEDYVKAIPTADVVEVVRCKDCEKWDTSNQFLTSCACTRWSLSRTSPRLTRPDDFCSFGKRKEVANSG